MKKISIVLLACAGFVINSNAADNFAARVVSYDPGVGFAPGFTNKSVVLGEPSRVNPYTEAVDPFNPPYGTNQVLSIGEGGSLVVKMDRPIFDTPRKPFGLDFIIFGNAGFIITNEFDLNTFNWIGEPATDGSMFGTNEGNTLVSVSADGVIFVPLAPRLVPTVDTLFPTDATGSFDVPVNPELTAADFAGATLADMLNLYAGSAGGAGFNVGWAHWRGRWVRLPFVRYIRIDVLSGKAEIDGICAVARTVRKPRR
jgi:hypothetical protein